MEWSNLILWLVVTIVSAEKCTNPLPALMQMASGVDVTLLDLFPIENTKDENCGLLENVFNFTCSGVKIGQRLDAKNKTSGDDFSNYDLPDQITDIYVDMDATKYGGLVIMNSDWASVMAALLYRVDRTNRDDTLGFFARSAKYTSLLKQHFGSNKAFYNIDKVRSSELVPDIRVTNRKHNGTGTRVNQSILSHDFIDYVNEKLPPKYEDNPAAYETFITRFGTHYFGRAYISDYDYVQAALTQDYVIDTSDDQISDDMAAAYKKYFKSWLNDGNDTISNTTGEIIFAYRNGSYRWVDKLSGTHYLSTKFKGVSIHRAELSDIDDLIENQTVQAQVQIAVKMHRIRAKLEELNNIYNFSNDYYQVSSEEKVALENVTKLVNSGDIKQIDQMVSNISELYDKVRRVRDKHFLTPVIDDLYVIASTRLEFAKQICTLSFKRFVKGHWSQGPANEVVSGEEKTSDLYELCHSTNGGHSLYDKITGYRDALRETRSVNQQFGLRADITKGLRAGCN